MNRSRHGGGEQKGLPGFRGPTEYVFDVVGEPDIQHLVGFVHNNELNLSNVHGAALHMVHQPAWSGHDYLDAPPHRFQLAAHGLSAIDGYDFYAGVLPEFRQLAFDLDG